MNPRHRTLVILLFLADSVHALNTPMHHSSRVTRISEIEDRVYKQQFICATRHGADEDENQTPDESKLPRIERHVSRRRWVASSLSSVVTAGSTLLTQKASAAPPLTAGMADSFAARAERALRLKPPKVLRPRMNLDFAVLLMRSSYNAVDVIDVVPMDQFQRDFFLIRQAEYQTYADALGPGAIQQGDLADPNYFDFISFAQYSTICREIINPPSIFEEQQPVEVGEGEPQKFVKVVVRRDRALTINDLPLKHTEIVGNAILDKLNEKFGETASAIPKIDSGSRPDASTLLASIKQVINLFVLSGFAWDGSASILQYGKSDRDAAETRFTINLTSPATLWSGQALKVSVITPFITLWTSFVAPHSMYHLKILIFLRNKKVEECHSDKRLCTQNY